MLKEVLEFLEKVDVRIAYPIEVCIFKEPSRLGQAAKGTIFIAPKVFEAGKRAVCLTLLEEYSHLESMEGDKSRGFQDFLLSQFLKSLEDKAGVLL